MESAAMVTTKPGHSSMFTFFVWLVRGIAAVILLQTLFFKFTGAPESVYIFTQSRFGNRA